MTWSNWPVYCQICGKFIGPAHLHGDGPDSFFRIDRCTCTCPLESTKIEILPPDISKEA
jgi:hypothetical protein